MMPAPTEYSCARVTSPSSTIDALAVVPPMSKVMIFGSALGARQRLRADHAARRARFDDVHRPLDGRRVGGQAAVRLHEQQRAPRCPRASRPLRSARR